jgi:hypothetical protein
MRLCYAAIDAKGRRSDEAVLDDRICECCQSSAAMTSDGPIAAYRDRSEEEVGDIHYVRKQPTGWSAPAPVHAENWKINACPVKGPSVAADGRREALAWTQFGKPSQMRVATADVSAFR